MHVLCLPTWSDWGFCARASGFCAAFLQQKPALKWGWLLISLFNTLRLNRLFAAPSNTADFYFSLILFFLFVWHCWMFASVTAFSLNNAWNIRLLKGLSGVFSVSCVVLFDVYTIRCDFIAKHWNHAAALSGYTVVKKTLSETGSCKHSFILKGWNKLKGQIWFGATFPHQCALFNFWVCVFTYVHFI